MRFLTRDVDRVESTWKQYVPSAVLHDVNPRRFRFEWYSADLGGVSLVRYDLAAEVRSAAEPQGQLLACRVDGPDAMVRFERGELGTGQPWLSDGPRIDARWDREARVTALVFDRENVQELARRISGDDLLTLRVNDHAPRSAGAGAAWERMFSYLEQTVDELGDDDSLLRVELGRHAAVATLAAFHTSAAASPRRAPQRVAAPGTVRRALNFIDENAHRPITVEDVATAVHISTRGLQYAFRRALDKTPAECLRLARLEGAHRELRSGSGSPVAAIAGRWGFSHPSRFAAAYRDVYGVLPSVTAARHRR